MAASSAAAGVMFSAMRKSRRGRTTAVRPREQNDGKRDPGQGRRLLQLGDRAVDELQDAVAAGTIFELLRQGRREQQRRDKPEDFDMPAVLARPCAATATASEDASPAAPIA